MEQQFEKYLAEAIGVGYAEKALSALSQEASVSIRFNPAKIAGQKPEDLVPHLGEQVAWSPYGHFLESRPLFTLDPRFHGGQYYVQDSSAMFVGHAFRQALKEFSHLDRPIRVLDLCAAPGGKTTDLAASLREERGDDFILVANEVMKQRAGILAENVARWGEPNVCVTSSDPAAFARLGGFFDIVVADVPCSGEGMFRKDEEALRQWSVENVVLCQSRQRRIVADVWASLAEGGILVYSTCTFNRLENDGNVSWIKDNLGADSVPIEIISGQDRLVQTLQGVSLVPGLVRGEGQYCAMMRKTVPAEACHLKPVKNISSHPFIDKTLDGCYGVVLKGDLITALPSNVYAEFQLLDVLHPILRGVAVGTQKGKDFIPHPDLAMSICLEKEAFCRVDLDLTDSLAFLHKDNLVLKDFPKGLLLLSYEGVAMGFVKNLGNRCNSLLPQNRRIRMAIQKGEGQI